MSVQDYPPEDRPFIRGYEQALFEFETQDRPPFSNPFPEGSDEHAGYEEGVYDLTQK